MALCRDCENMSLTNYRDSSTRSGLRCYCKEYRRYEDPDSRACSSRFIPRDPRKKYYVSSRIMDILGISENDYIYEVIEDMKDNTLENNDQYIGLLSLYDIVGPMIANELENDQEYGLMNCEIAFENFIMPTCELYEDGLLDEAVSKYVEMVEELMTNYGLDLEEILYNKENELIRTRKMN